MVSGAAPPRLFGFWTGLWVVVASMVGVGVLTSSGYTLHYTASPASLLVLWTLGGILALSGSLTIAELATALPSVGGDYIYIREFFGRGLAFVYGWATLILGFAAPTALIAHAAVVYLIAPFMQRVPASSQTPVILLGASFLIVFFTWSHCLGQKKSAWIQDITTIFKAVTLFLMVAAGFIAGSGDWNHLFQGRSLWVQEPGALAVSLVYVMYSYTGWNGTIYLAGEMKQPEKNLPRSLIGGCLLVTLLYVLLNLLYVYALDPVAMTTMPENEFKPVAELACRFLFGEKISVLVAMIFGIGILASVSSYIFTGPRVIYAMAQDGLFFHYAGRLHPQRMTPVAATVTQGLVAVLLLWSGSFEELLSFAGVGLGILSAFVVLCVFRLRRRRDLAAPFKTPLYPLPPILYLVITAWMVVFAAMDQPKPALLSVLCIALGFPIYLLIRFRQMRGIGR